MTSFSPPRLRAMDPREALIRYERWRIQEAKFSPKTWAGEKPGLLGFIDTIHNAGIGSMHNVEPDLVSAWWTSLDYQESTMATRLSQLRSFLGYCVNRGWIESDPSVLLRANKPVAEVREHLAPAELLALIEATVYPRDRILVALAVNLALRGGEIARLRIKDLNLEAGTLIVRPDKTHSDPDPMPITADLDAELRRWLHHYQHRAAVAPDSYLVPAQHVEPNTGRITYRTTRPTAQPYEVVKKGLTKLGWETVKGEGVHTCRRSVARIYFDMVEADESFDSALLATMTLLHHERPETTLRYIGRDRLVMARDAKLRGRPFLTRLAGNVTPLRAVR